LDILEAVMTKDLFLPKNLTLGQKVKLARVARGLKQSDVARFVDVAQTDISRLERGQNVRPGAEGKILRGLGLLPDGIEYYSRLAAAYVGAPKVRRYFERRLQYLKQQLEQHSLRL
jgi:transcriptional regulator with XRE-family HTH domain